MIKQILFVIVLTSISASSYAVEKCPEKLGSTSKYNDLNVVIKCLNRNIEHLNNEIIKLKNNNTLSQAPNATHLASGQRVDDEGLTYRLLNCSVKGGTVACEFSIINSGEDKKLYLYAKKNSRAIDFNGNEYLANATSIGGSDKKFYTKKIMVTDVPMIAKVYFPAVPKGVTGFSLIELHTRNSRVKFKNVEIK